MGKYFCPGCGRKIHDGEWIICEECGRPIYGCPLSKCSFIGFLDDPKDPLKCNHEDCPHFYTKNQDEHGIILSKNLKESLKRQISCLRQMQSHSGPIYEQSVSRAKPMREAYKNMGKPRRVSRAHGPNGPEYFYTSSRKPCTDQEYKKWVAWRSQRDKLHKQLFGTK